MKVVIACDSFKGSATAAEVCAALGRGWQRARPADDIIVRPMADGGEGTLDAFEAGVPGAVRHPIRVAGPLGEAHEASFLTLPDGTAVVELASTSGITLVPEGGLRPLDATTTGFGQAVASALGAGAVRVLLAVGSSCSTDGGAGALTALGARFSRADGAPIASGARGLADLASVDLDGLAALPAGGAVVLSDVTNPLTGPTGAAAVFGPQKGATADDVVLIDRWLAHYAELMPGDPGSATAPGAGAAGGTGFGLLAWGAMIRSGAGFVADLVGLPGAIAEADVVITGEGRFDDQSAAGKAPSVVLALAEQADVPTLLVAGSITADTKRFATAVSLSELAGETATALQNPTRWLERAGATLAMAWPAT